VSRVCDPRLSLQGKWEGRFKVYSDLSSTCTTHCWGKPLLINQGDKDIYGVTKKAGWRFQTFFVFHNIWDNPSHWLIFFKIVKPPTRRLCFVGRLGSCYLRRNGHAWSFFVMRLSDWWPRRCFRASDCFQIHVSPIKYPMFKTWFSTGDIHVGPLKMGVCIFQLHESIPRASKVRHSAGRMPHFWAEFWRLPAARSPFGRASDADECQDISG